MFGIDNEHYLLNEALAWALGVIAFAGAIAWTVCAPRMQHRWFCRALAVHSALLATGYLGDALGVDDDLSAIAVRVVGTSWLALVGVALPLMLLGSVRKTIRKLDTLAATAEEVTP